MRFKKDGHYHKDFGYYKLWCKQQGKNPSHADVLQEFIDGLPLYEDDLGELCLSDDVAYSMKYGYYNERQHELTNATIAECVVEEVLG
jgi:hypothetical protein